MPHQPTSAPAMSEMPILQTRRLRIRPSVIADLPDVRRILDVTLREGGLQPDEIDALSTRARWLEWTVLSYAQLARLHQPPYGDRAILLLSSGQIIGASSFVPCLSAFEPLPALAARGTQEDPSFNTTEFGLFYTISPAHQRRGYASEAARAPADYALRQLRLKRIVATTTYENAASIRRHAKAGNAHRRGPAAGPALASGSGSIRERFEARGPPARVVLPSRIPDSWRRRLPRAEFTATDPRGHRWR